MTILHCLDCGNKLSEFEESKVNRLKEYWGMMRKIDPRCRECYNRKLEERASTISSRSPGLS